MPLRTIRGERRGVLHRQFSWSTVEACVASVALATALAACGGANTAPTTGLQIFPASPNRATARLIARNGSAVNGRFSFVQHGQKVAVVGTVFDLTPGPHSIHVHETPNCSSPNAASAGAVWNIPGVPAPGRARTGDLPELQANPDGLALMSVEVRGLTVGSGAADDLIGHSVVVQDGYVRDPRAQFGVPNGWIACGVIERE